MFVLLGAICIFSRIDCTPIGMIGHPFASKAKCEAVKEKIDVAIKPVDWLDGVFECVEDQTI